MKKYLPHILIAAVVLTGAFAPISYSVIQAQAETDTPQLVEPPADDGSCGWRNMFTFKCLVLEGLAKIVLAVMWMTSIGLYIAGGILDLSVKYTLNMSDLVNNVSVVEIGWTIFRDLANIFFIFLILWLAIKTILGLGGGTSGNMGMLMRIIIVALLINFSLFITKTVIDAGNIAALHFYTLIVGDDGSLAGVFMQGLRLSTVFNSSVIGQLTGAKILIVGIFGSILILVAAWVFLAAALMFLYRAIVLIVLMIVSPLAFISWVIPSQTQHASEWWNQLFKQTFFAPIFMVMAYAIGKAIQTTQNGFNLAPTASITAALDMTSSSPNPDNLGVIVNFILLIGMLVATLIVASSMGARGAKTMISWGKKIQGAGTGVLKNLTAKGVGKGAQKLEERYGDRWRESGRIAGRLALRTTDKLQTMKIAGGKSFKEQKEKGTLFAVGEKEIENDLRELRDKPQKLAQYIASLSPKNQRFSYEKLSARDRAAVEGSFPTPPPGEQSVKDKLFAQLSPEEQSKTLEARRKAEREKLELAVERSSVEQIEGIAQGKISTAVANPATGANYTQFEINRIVSNTGKSITDLDFNIVNNQSVVEAMSDDQIKAVKEASRLSNEQKNQITALRELRIRNALGMNPGTSLNPSQVENIMRGMSNEAKTQLNADILSNKAAAQYLSPNVLEAIMKKLNVNQTQNIVSVITADLNHPSYSYLTSTPAGAMWGYHPPPPPPPPSPIIDPRTGRPVT